MQLSMFSFKRVFQLCFSRLVRVSPKRKTHPHMHTDTLGVYEYVYIYIEFFLHIFTFPSFPCALLAFSQTQFHLFLGFPKSI